MKFPLINDKSMIWRPLIKKGKCSLCGKKPKDGIFIALNGGALKGTKDNAIMDSGLIGFLTLDLHDHNKMGKGFLNIVDSSPNGQFEFYFCSTKCLRKFFDKVIDAFEETLN